MKNFLYIILISIVMASGVKAQTPSLRLGFEFSPQISWMMSDHNRVESNGTMGGYSFGLIVDRFFAPNYAFTSGISIHTTGGKLKYLGEDGVDMVVGDELLHNQTRLTYRLKYIDIPMGIKLLTGSMDRNRFFLQMGLNHQFNIKTNNGSGKSIKDEVRLYNVGYHVGGGMEYSLGGSTHVRSGIIFQSSFNDITSNRTVSDKVMLRKVVMSVGIMF